MYRHRIRDLNNLQLMILIVVTSMDDDPLSFPQPSPFLPYQKDFQVPITTCLGQDTLSIYNGRMKRKITPRQSVQVTCLRICIQIKIESICKGWQQTVMVRLGFHSYLNSSFRTSPLPFDYFIHIFYYFTQPKNTMASGLEEDILMKH